MSTQLTADPPKNEVAPSRKRIDPLVGTILDDRFQIEEVLGSGGMSVVYLAKQLRVNRHVAIKTLRMQLDEKPIYRERFHNEINLLCALNHPNIVTVYDCVIGPDDQPYVVMDYLRGRSLEVLINQEGPIALDRFVRMAVQVCGALDHAHRKGVIHRDLKPGNIVLMDDEMDFVKVVDFGLAKLNDTNRRLTQSGELWGSPPYMSPEHCQSKPEDERSDLYSFGAVMYELLTGKDPYHYATTAYELIQIHINTPPPAMCETNPLVTVPKPIEDVIFKCLAKNPEDRYQNAAELRDAIVAATEQMKIGNSGDLLSFPSTGKANTNSRELLPFAGAEPRSMTPSEHFRRALDPMQGIGIDELFDGTANDAKTSSGSAKLDSNGFANPAVSQNAQNAAIQNSNNSGNVSVPTTSSPQINLRNLAEPDPEKRSIVTPRRVATAVVAICAIFLLNALPNLLHPTKRTSESNSTDLVDPNKAEQPQSKTSTSEQTSTTAQKKTQTEDKTTLNQKASTSGDASTTGAPGSPLTAETRSPGAKNASTTTNQRTDHALQAGASPAHAAATSSVAPKTSSPQKAVRSRDSLVETNIPVAHPNTHSRQTPRPPISHQHNPPKSAPAAKVHAPQTSAGAKHNPWDVLQGMRK